MIHEAIHSMGSFGNWFSDMTSIRGINEGATEYYSQLINGNSRLSGLISYDASTRAVGRINEQFARLNPSNDIFAYNFFVKKDVTTVRTIMDKVWREYSGETSSLFDEINKSMCILNGYNPDTGEPNSVLSQNLPHFVEYINLNKNIALFEKAVDAWLQKNT